MKKLISTIIMGIFLLSPFVSAGHPKKYKEELSQPPEEGETNQKGNRIESIDNFTETLNDYFGNKRQLTGSEVNNQYNVYMSIQESKYWRWLVTLTNNLVSKDLYSLLFMVSRNEAIKMLEDKPNGTGMLRAVYHEKGSIAMTYVEDNIVKHALLDVSSLTNYSLRNVLFCSKLSILENILVLGYDSENKQAVISLPKNLLRYPVDENLVNEII